MTQEQLTVTVGLSREAETAFRSTDRGAATFSCDGKYRYALTRLIAEQTDDARWICFIMLNPSRADERTNDATIRRCIGFASKFGFDGLAVVNLFALRSRDPRKLRIDTDPVGPLNDLFVKQVAARCERVVCAWGANLACELNNRGRNVVAMLRMSPKLRPKLRALSITNTGFPRHPLYLPKSSKLCPFPPPGTFYTLP